MRGLNEDLMGHPLITSHDGRSGGGFDHCGTFPLAAQAVASSSGLGGQFAAFGGGVLAPSPPG
jgi:hypothetical protein